MNQDKYEKYLQSFYSQYMTNCPHYIKDKIHEQILLSSYLFNDFLVLKKNIQIYNQDFQIIVLSCSRQSKDNSIIYGYIYLKDSIPVYINYSPSFISMDGEYRRRFMPYDQFEAILEEYSSVISVIEEYIRLQITNNKLYITSNVINSVFDSVNTQPIADYISTSILPVKCLSLAYLIQQIIIHRNSLESHIHPLYTNILFDQNSSTVYKNAIKDLSDPVLIHKLNHYVNRIMYKANEHVSYFNLECGQKIIPLSYIELDNIMDKNFPVWLEIYCQIQAESIFINNISPSFSLFGGWTIINSTIDMYDNPAMKMKFNQNDKIINTIEDINKIKKQFQLQQSIHRALVNPIHMIKERMILSPYALLVVSRYQGRTWGDLPSLYNTLFYRETHDLYNNIHSMTKMMFEMLYSLYTLNTLVHCIHSDLHLNNCTIDVSFVKYIYNIKCDKRDKTPCTIYSINEKEYIFIGNPFHFNLIDYSRAILNPVKQDISLDVFKDTILSYYQMYFNDFFTLNKTKIEIATLQSPEQVYNIMTAIDSYQFTSKLLEQMKTFKGITVSNDNKLLLTQINKMAKSHLLDTMTLLFEKNIQVENFNIFAINSLFNHCQMQDHHKNDSNLVITEYYRYKPELKYDSTHFEQLPEFMKKFKKEIKKAIDNKEQSTYYEKAKTLVDHDFVTDNDIPEKLSLLVDTDPYVNNLL